VTGSSEHSNETFGLHKMQGLSYLAEELLPFKMDSVPRNQSVGCLVGLLVGWLVGWLVS
jgi:hypothetical protein